MPTKPTTTKKAPTKKTTAPKAKASKAAPKAAAKAATAKPVAKPVTAKVAPKVLPVKTEKPITQTPKGTYYYANGKRKTSVASVRLYKDGKGAITVNGRTFETYFPVFVDQDKILAPLRLTSNVKGFDITVHVHGGGIHSQAEAVRHGISKALLEVDAAARTTLKSAGFLTRDSRVKERKKYGLKRARRAPQFSKR